MPQLWQEGPPLPIQSQSHNLGHLRSPARSEDLESFDLFFDLLLVCAVDEVLGIVRVLCDGYGDERNVIEQGHEGRRQSVMFFYSWKFDGLAFSVLSHVA